VIWSLLFGVVELLPSELLLPELPPLALLLAPLDPLWDSAGVTVRVMYAAFMGLLFPAVSCSHTASIQTPVPGTVMVAGPSAGAGSGSVQAPDLLAGQT
jgi:hypothetical protein